MTVKGKKNITKKPKPRTSALDLVRTKYWIKETENSFSYCNMNGLEMPNMNTKFNF